MVNIKEKIIYGLVLFIFLIGGIGFGYFSISKQSSKDIEDIGLVDFALNYQELQRDEGIITASTKTYDIDVIYEDNYTICNENTLTPKKYYGTTMDKVKEEEKKYQEENGLIYEIKGESESKIIYTRTLNQNCPNHFQIILEGKSIVVYSIQAEDKKVVYMTLENINIDNIREELRTKIEKGTYINSKDELNSFIEDLES